MSSECFASWATSPSYNPSSSGKQSTLVKKVIEFLHANLCEACVDSDYGYGFLDGTVERKEDFIEQFTTLNSKCLVRSTTHVKERSQKIIRKRYFQSSLLFLFCLLCLQFLGKRKRLRKTEDESRQAMPRFSCLYYKTT